MSNSSSNSAMGGLVEVLRQRYFIDHSAEAKKFVTEEYTLMSKGDKITNIFLKVPYFLPNLIVFDSDNEELPVLPDSHTRVLIDIMIEQYQKSDQTMVTKLENLKQDLHEHKYFLIWIKLPEKKELSSNEVRVINLEYDARLEKPKKFIHLIVKSPDDYSVFYIIKSPEDHDLDTQSIVSSEPNEFPSDSWEEDAQKYMYFTKTSDSVSLTAKHGMSHDLTLTYSFKPHAKIIQFPRIVLGLLSLFAIGVIGLDMCNNFSGCSILNPDTTTQILNKEIEINIGIIAASLVLPGLIHNAGIRHSLKWYFFIPILLAMVSILFI